MAVLDRVDPSKNMGIGPLGNPGTILKRKFRYTFSVNYCRGTKTVGEAFVKTAARPNLEIEDTEINFLNAKSWISGKASWQTITVTYLDVAGPQSANLLSWLASVYNFTENGVPFQQGSARQDYEGIGVLRMYDGCGGLLETWTYSNVWPTGVNFGDVDYSSSDIAEIELTLRYSNVTYVSNCGGVVAPCSCTPCGS